MVVVADLQFTARMVLSNGDECKTKLGNIWGSNLPLELWCIACNREYMCEKSCGSFYSRQRYLFLRMVSSKRREYGWTHEQRIEAKQRQPNS